MSGTILRRRDRTARPPRVEHYSSAVNSRIGRVEGTRELVIPKTPFIVPYRIHGDVIDILAVHHTSQRWPTAF